MDKLFQSVALVRQTDGNQSKYLLSWTKELNRWEFIVADRLNQESFRESVTREVAWQLNLDRKSEFLVSNMAQLSMEYVEDLPNGLQQHIAVAFYNVQIYGRRVVENLSLDSSLRWMTAAEICQGETAESHPIHPRVVAWINKWNVVQSWQ